MYENVLKRVEGVDLSRWGFEISFGDGDNLISKTVEQFLGVVEFEFSFPLKRSNPLDMRVFVALDECGYKTNPYVDVDIKSEVAYLIQGYVLDREEGCDDMRGELLAMAKEFINLSKEIMLALNEEA